MTEEDNKIINQSQKMQSEKPKDFSSATTKENISSSTSAQERRPRSEGDRGGYRGYQGQRDSRNTPQSGDSRSRFGNREGGFVRRDGQPNSRPGQATSGNTSRDGRRSFSKKPRSDKRPRQEEQSDLDSQLIEVKRVTRVVKGGKRMRFAALVVVGDRKGQVGMGFMKGMDFQDAVAKATKKAKDNLIKVNLSEDKSINYPIQFKFKAAQVFMKPATKGTGLIAGGYLRPVLELVGVENVYTKILGSNNKISGVQAVIQALQKFN